MCVIVSQDAKLYVLTQPWDIELFHLTKSLSHIFQKKSSVSMLHFIFLKKRSFSYIYTINHQIKIKYLYLSINIFLAKYLISFISFTHFI